MLDLETKELLDNAANLNRVEDIEVKSGQLVPAYEMGGFINTAEGWNLFVKCRKDRNMREYQIARDIFARNEIMGSSNHEHC